MLLLKTVIETRDNCHLMTFNFVFNKKLAVNFWISRTTLPLFLITLETETLFSVMSIFSSFRRLLCSRRAPFPSSEDLGPAFHFNQGTCYLLWRRGGAGGHLSSVSHPQPQTQSSCGYSSTRSGLLSLATPLLTVNAAAFLRGWVTSRFSNGEVGLHEQARHMLLI